jgi:inner membrane protein
MKYPLLARALTIAAVAFLVLFPIKLIEGKISERRALADRVVAQFAAETSGPQAIAGPLLALTCEETFTEERQVMRGGKAETIAEKKVGQCPTVFVPPRVLRIAGKMPVETRHRGIYGIRLYRASLDIAADFEWPAPATWNGLNQRVWKNAYLVTAVSDPRGIKAARSETTAALTQGKDDVFDGRFAIREDLGEYKARKVGEALAFRYLVELAGTSSLAIAPVGDATEIRLASNWPHPSFGGAWTPDERRITAEGFEATWRMSHLATGGQAIWDRSAREGKLLNAAAAAGVSLFDPVNVYTLSYRATEYAFLFVLFTFAALALAETLSGIRLHAVQYALVGSALAVFFLLLIALSEHIAFAQAYGSAAAACVALLTFYLRHPLASWARTAAFFALFTTLYGTLFVLLKSEDHALLMGSLLVFAVLAVTMIATRKVDWAAAAARMIGPRPVSAGASASSP